MSDTDTPTEDPQATEQQQDDTMRIVVLVLGIVSMWTCQLLGPVALVLGYNQYRIGRDEGREADPLIIAGMVLGGVATAMLLFAVLLMALYCGGMGLYVVFMIFLGVLGAL